MNALKGRVHLVIPALNEEENLKVLLPKLVSLYRVVVVDNGSTDATARVVKNCGAELLTCTRRGYGSAVNTGFKYVMAQVGAEAGAGKQSDMSGSIECVVVFDADGTSPLEAIPELASAILNSEADLAIAQRTSQERGAMPFHARFGNSLQTFLIGVFTGVKYLDMGPLRALSLAALRRLEMTDPTWGWNVEMQIKAALFRFRIKETKINYKKRIYGESKISGSVLGSVKAGCRIVWAVFWYVGVVKARQLFCMRKTHQRELMS